MKKESDFTKEMTTEEIRKKLSKFKNFEEQLEYLDKIIKHGALKIKTWNSLYQNLGEIYEQHNEYTKAGEAYERAKMKDKAKYAYLKAVEEGFGKTKQAAKNNLLEKVRYIDSVATSILAFGGIGTLFTFFSKSDVISAQNVQLAPPFPNYLIYIFLAMFIGGIAYFLAKKIKK